MPDKTYNSIIDTWLIVLLGLSLSAILFRGLMSLRFSTAYAVMVLGVFAFTVLVLLLFCYPCRYTLKADHLLIQSGALRFRVDYADITRIEPSRSWWSGPALSLQRVRIDHGRRCVLVSPMQRERFIEDLAARVDAVPRA
ncbi:MAG: PH domain-containing protein [Steroidobacteraceae bacterium]